ncbi:MAG TPA: isoprenylcysteine carboxylmethyltransferase family protein [Terriglobales bacterium]|nr:isoprenylcysteine carboxylmethyltransferase family protein [Terriglobales bacterium]
MAADWPSIARRIRVPVGFIFAVGYLWLARPTGSSIAVGAVIAVPGLWLRGLASGHIEKNEQLTTSGPYAHTRNPLYLGSLILAAAFAVAARSPWIVLLMALIFIGIYLPVIQSEEDFLRRTFPGFTEYSARVPRLLPRWERCAGGSGEFSWQLYRKHREYNAILGASGIFAVLLFKLLWMGH